uniref:RING-type domain-containing protein n=1 Tax=Angiostrongylus cantonensis TaxID=6313 RepID=A0A0K0DAJ2_ANGCA
MDRPRRNVQNGFSSVLRLSRTPFPSVSSYIAISLFISFVALANVLSVFKSQPEVRALLREEILNSSLASTYDSKNLEYLSSLTVVQLLQYIKGNSPLVWVSTTRFLCGHCLYVVLIAFKLAFKELTRQEEVTARNGFLSFLIVVFLSVVAGAHQSHRVLPWLLWFGIIGFVTVLHDITYQRFKFVSKIPFYSSISCFAFSMTLILLIFKFHGQINLNHMLFLLVDALISLLRSLHGLLRCLSSSERFAHSPDTVRHFNYWLDLSVTLATDAIQLLNYVSFGVAILNTLARHHKHNQIFLHIQSTYPVEEAEGRDLCIVCWEKLGLSRRLPCGHQFHDWCLMWWLAQDGSCPTCRRAISAPPLMNPQPSIAPASTTTFRFGGRFGFLRLPSFSIEFSTGASPLNPFLRRQTQNDDLQLIGMANQVHEMFPRIPFDVIMEDLRISRSSQATIDNILEGRIGFIAEIGGNNVRYIESEKGRDLREMALND